SYFDAEGGESCYWYNDDFVVTKIRDPLGNITHTEWEYGQKTAYTDALGRRTEYCYTDYGEISKLTQSNGELLLYRYNEDGLLTNVMNSRGESWQYRYGSRNELRFVMSPDNLK
ncbi:hypothetical protein RYD26_12765, partial [Pasteurellaceae bacterium LIM206]|nr:hypothetical protein [Pasteurellaceae bacterium LIM206]